MIVHLAYAFVGFLLGFLVCAILAAGSRADDAAEAHQAGRYKMMTELQDAEQDRHAEWFGLEPDVACTAVDGKRFD